jgi:hypothetical protein
MILPPLVFPDVCSFYVYTTISTIITFSNTIFKVSVIEITLDLEKLALAMGKAVVPVTLVNVPVAPPKITSRRGLR